MSILDLSIKELSDKLVNKEIKYEEVTNFYINRIEEHDSKINSFVTKTFDIAIEKSKELQKKVNKNKTVGSLAGIPVAIKDNMCIKDVKTTCASLMLDKFVSPYTSTAVGKILGEDAILLGKLNMDEFAMGGSNENSYYGSVRNPWDIRKVPGGSSGGSAASIASQFTKITLGSDTGGSIRQPASFCGVVGLKPTYGRVSRYGLVAFGSSLDQIGPLTNSVEDCAVVLNHIAGVDKMDATSSNIKIEDYTKYLSENIKGKKLAYIKEYFDKGISEDVKKKIFEAFETLKALGATVEEIDFPLTEYAIPTYYLISSAEASSNLARYDGIKYGYRTEKFENLIDIYKNSRSEGFGDEVKRRIMLGTYALSSGYYDAYYKKALKVRNLIKQSFLEKFKEYDGIIGPVAPTTAYNIGEKNSNPLEMYLGDIYTVSANIAGIPAISVPAGFSKERLPIGLQIMSKQFDEGNLLNIAYAFEKAQSISKVRPNF